MSNSSNTIDALVRRDYKAGFVTDIESDTLPPGLSEDVVRFISARKGEPEWLLEWRLGAGMVAYTTSKAAVAALTVALGEEVVKQGILVRLPL